MSFRPAIPFDGLAGWAFLKRTAAAQRAAFDASPMLARDEAYFRAKIGQVMTADDLVADRRLLGVALGAFGLDADIGNKAFIRKVLADGTLREGALSNRLADKQYRAFSAAFGFGDYPTPNTVGAGFADKLVAAWKERRFEGAVGEQSNALRLAMNAGRELPALAARPISDEAKWLTVLGNRPLRELFQTAFNLPPQFVSLDLDRQVEVLRSRSAAAFGTSELKSFAEPAAMERLTRRFLAMGQIAAAASPAAPASAALTLLQAGQAHRLSLRL